jgi:cyanate permease
MRQLSGLQIEMWKKPVTWKVHLHGVDSGAPASSMAWLACVCQRCPKK